MTNEAERHPPTLSFIIPVYNCLEFTKLCLASLERTVCNQDYEVIIVDDGSTDETPAFLESLKGPYRIIHNEHNRGYAYSNNVAAKVAKGRFLVLLNNDVILRPNWLEPMLECFGRYERMGFVGNIQRNARTGHIDHAGIIFNPYGAPEHYGHDFIISPFGDVVERKAVTAACCLIDRNVFLGEGGFDETYLNGFEDIDLCLRLSAKGYCHYVANKSVVDHFVSTSPTRKERDLENAAVFLNKWRLEIGVHELREWARNYLFRNLRKPHLFNGRKLLDALGYLMGLRRGVPSWALAKRETILHGRR